MSGRVQVVNRIVGVFAKPVLNCAPLSGRKWLGKLGQCTVWFIMCSGVRGLYVRECEWVSCGWTRRWPRVGYVAEPCVLGVPLTAVCWREPWRWKWRGSWIGYTVSPIGAYSVVWNTTAVGIWERMQTLVLRVYD